jgi:hypothetical protein
MTEGHEQSSGINLPIHCQPALALNSRKDIDANEPTGQPMRIQVITHHRQHGDRTKSIDVDTIAGPAANRCVLHGLPALLSSEQLKLVASEVAQFA